MKKFFALVSVMIFLATFIPAVWADAPIEGRAGRAEVRFLEGMIDHHQMALDMAAHCLTKAESEALLTLCQAVIDAQSAEIAQMQGWLKDWYGIDYTPMPMGANTPPAAGGGSGMGMMGGGSGMDMMGGGSGMGGMMEMMSMMQGMSPEERMQMMQDMPMSDMMSMMGDMMSMMDMMSNMTMMEMMSMMMGGGSGMGMMGGGNAAPPMGMGRMNDQPMLNLMAAIYAMQTITLGDLVTMTADVDENTLFIEVLQHHIGAMMDMSQMDLTTMMPLMEKLTPAQMMQILGEMETLTLKEVLEMKGHLEDSDNKTLADLMVHHLETMVGDAPAGGDEHSEHHPADATPEPTDHSQHDGAAAPAAGGDEHSQHHPEGGAQTDPAMTMGMMAGFNRLMGRDYELAWLESMIDHHDDALHMSTRILTFENIHPETRALAEAIIAAQTAEIGQMEGMILELEAAQ